MVTVAIALLVIGLIGMAMSAKTINDYGDGIMAGLNSYTDLYQVNYTTARQKSYADHKLMNLSDTISKVRDMCIEDEIIQVAPERAELYQLLAEAASLVDTIRARS